MGVAVPALRDLALDVDQAGPRVLAVTWIALERAALCLDCEACYELGAPACPKCGSRSWTLLGRFLADQRTRRPEAIPDGGDATVTIGDVLHHAGAGLTPARFYAETLAEVLELGIAWPPPTLMRLAARRARQCVHFIDLTMARLRGLAPTATPPPGQKG